MSNLSLMRPIDSLTNQLKFIIQPLDLDTINELGELGFQKIPAIPQLVYQEVTETQLAAVFRQLSRTLTDASQAASRFLLTRLPLEDNSLLLEFLQAQPLSVITNCVRNAWFFHLLLKQCLLFKYQPIFDLGSGEIIAHECLARALSEQGQYLSGQQLIDAALSTKLTREFDELAREICLDSIAALNTNQTFFINVLPNAIINNFKSLEQNLEKVLALGLQPHQIVFELTEVEILAHCPNLPQLINRLRKWGFGIAVDDLCGCVSIDHYVMEIRPDFVKLDRRLIDGCSKHPLKQTLIKSLLHSAHEEGILVVAEGLEQRKDIECCRDLGMDYGQGFGLGRPELTLQQQSSTFRDFSMSKAS